MEQFSNLLGQYTMNFTERKWAVQNDKYFENINMT